VGSTIRELCSRKTRGGMAEHLVGRALFSSEKLKNKTKGGGKKRIFRLIALSHGFDSTKLSGDFIDTREGRMSSDKNHESETLALKAEQVPNVNQESRAQRGNLRLGGADLKEAGTAGVTVSEGPSR